jgi:hypothetical protein
VEQEHEIDPVARDEDSRDFFDLLLQMDWTKGTLVIQCENQIFGF